MTKKYSTELDSKTMELLALKRNEASDKFRASTKANYAYYAKHGRCKHDPVPEGEAVPAPEAPAPVEPEPAPDPWLEIAAKAAAPVTDPLDIFKE